MRKRLLELNVFRGIAAVAVAGCFFCLFYLVI